MQDFNSFTIIGRLGKDAIIRETTGYTKYVSFSLAATMDTKSSEPTWFNCAIFRDIGKAEQYLTMGQKIAVTGILSISKYADGSPAYNINVTNFNIQFTASKDDPASFKENPNPPKQKVETNPPKQKVETNAAKLKTQQTSTNSQKKSNKPYSSNSTDTEYDEYDDFNDDIPF